MEWKEIAIAIGGFLGGLLFNLFVKVLPTYIDLSKENSDLREKIRELESELEDGRELREKEYNDKFIDPRGLKEAIDTLQRRRKTDVTNDGP